MLTILVVAAGGALGSVLRLLVGNAGAALVGTSFPWPTIVINIAGSAVIGFVGTSTLPGGLLPSGPVLRAFVMVGICGGFTTFSSFSLQTLDLVREARPLAAFGNVAFSVLLCLAGVAAGHAVAATAAVRQAGRAADGALHEGTTVLALLDHADQAGTILDVAETLLRTSGGGRIGVLALRPAAPDVVSRTEDVTPEAGEADGGAEMLRETFDGWRDRPGRIAPRADWVEPSGDLALAVGSLVAGSDVVAMERPREEGRAGARPAVLHGAIFDGRRPVVLVPPAWRDGLSGRHVAIAWSGDRRVKGAVRTALPLLRAADQVTLLTDGGAARPPTILAEAGITAVTRPLPGEGPAGPRLLAAARDIGADLLVLGAYRHSAFRERLLGGVTNHVLANAELPVLMRH